MNLCLRTISGPLAVVAGILASAGDLRAAEPEPLVQARRAIGQAVPHVAVTKLRLYLAAPRIAAGDRRDAQHLLAEALLAAGDPEEAAAVLAPLADRPGIALLKAHISAARGYWQEALAAYTQLAAAPDATPAARWGQVEALERLNRHAEAAEILAAMDKAGEQGNALLLRLASAHVHLGRAAEARGALARLSQGTLVEERERQYLEGRVLLLVEQPDPARQIFENLIAQTEGMPDRLLADATIGLADAFLQLHGAQTADRPLEGFISRHPGSLHLERVFQRLDAIYDLQEHPPEGELRRWSQKPPDRRAEYAFFFISKVQIRERKWDRAEASLSSLITKYPRSVLLAEAHLMQADVALARNQFSEAVTALESAMRNTQRRDLRAGIELRTAIVHYQQGEYLLAANLFRSAAARSPDLGEAAEFNAALSSLQQRNYELFLEEYRRLSTLFPESPLRGDLVIEQGLVQARAGDPKARETLGLFVQQFAGHGREGEARLALAELAFEEMNGAADPVRRAAAGERALELLQVANKVPSDDREHAAKAQYLALCLAESQQPPDEGKVIGIAQEFLVQHGTSDLVPEVRLKLGQVYFRRGDYANAETQFTLLARDYPNDSLTEPALFLAGQSAMKMIDSSAVDRGLKLFGEVAQRGGPLRLYARQEQALAEVRLGHESEALALYDLILGAQPGPDPELRYAVLCAKGDTLLSMARSDPLRYDAAMKAFDLLAAGDDAPAQWRNQALFKKGQALEQLGRKDEALAAFYDVLDRNGASPDREWFWYYKAGFDAARLCESQEQWAAAIGVYEKMVKAAGPRTAEARARVRQLRLEKFIWE